MRMSPSGRLWIPEAPNLILGRGPCPRASRELFVALPGPRVEGIISYELIHARTGIVRQRGTFRNLIVDAALNQIGSGGLLPWQMIAYIGVGTGSTAPANAQTDLVTPLGARVNRTTTGDGTNGSGASFAYWYWQKVYLFLEAESNGNLAEVGFFSALSGGTMWARQLFKDGTGTPTVLTKTSSDQLRITYEMRIYPPTVDVTGNVTISGTSYAYTSRASSINSNIVWGSGGSGMLLSLGTWATGDDCGDTNTLGTTSGVPPATSWVAATSTTNAAYTAGTFYRDVTNVWDPGIANFAGGIGSFRLWRVSGTGLFQMVVTPKFNKDSTKRLTLVTRRSFGRYP